VLNRTIEPGTTGKVKTGESLVEQPGDVHEGGNRGTVPVRIELCSLFSAGAPNSIPVR
jgi:quercetin dioxygenase-like cupin family protein